MECLQAPLRTPSSPDRSRLVPLALDYTRLSRPKPTEPGACSQATTLETEVSTLETEVSTKETEVSTLETEVCF